MKNRCFTLNLQNHVMLQPYVSNYFVVAHYPCLLYYLFNENDQIHELLSDLCYYYLYSQLNLTKDENYDIQYYYFVHAEIISYQDLMLQSCFDDFALIFYEQFFDFMSLLLIAYFSFFKYLKFNCFVLNYLIVLKLFHHYQEFFFLKTQVFFEFDQGFLMVCYLT